MNKLACAYCGHWVELVHPERGASAVDEARCGQCLLIACDDCMDGHPCSSFRQGDGLAGVERALAEVRGDKAAPQTPVRFATPETTEPSLIGSVVDSETARLMASTVLDALTPEPSPQEMQK